MPEQYPRIYTKYVFPKNLQRFLVKVGIYAVIFFGGGVLLLNIINMGMSSIIGLYYYWIILIPIFADMYHEIRKKVVCLVEGVDIFGRVVMNKERIMLCKFKHVIVSLDWKDVVVMEKAREYGERTLSIITNPYNDVNVVMNPRKKNYISVPYSMELEKAVEHYSGRKVELADPEVNRHSKA